MPKGKKQVKITSYKGIRNDAACENCGMEWDIHGQNTLNQIRTHVKKTGHEVARTYGSETRYTLEANL